MSNYSDIQCHSKVATDSVARSYTWVRIVALREILQSRQVNTMVIRKPHVCFEKPVLTRQTSLVVSLQRTFHTKENHVMT